VVEMCVGSFGGADIQVSGEEKASELKAWQYSLQGISTYQEEKELALKMWRYLRDHPHLKRKSELPHYILSRIAVYEDLCPVCTVFKDFCEGGKRHNCPLKGCVDSDGVYMRWFMAGDDKTRRERAIEIIQRLEAWNGEI